MIVDSNDTHDVNLKPDSTTSCVTLLMLMTEDMPTVIHISQAKFCA